MIYIKARDDMPGGIYGFTVEDQSGDYTVFVNANLSDEARERTIQHELQHIKNGDLERRDLTGCEAEQRSKDT